MKINDTFTSTGLKFFHHQEMIEKLRDGRGQPVVSHVMLTDVCNHTCAFCSVQARAGDSLPFYDVVEYLNTLRKYGLKAVILSGGGNPILYRCKASGKNFNDVVDAVHGMGLEIGLITNGMPMMDYEGAEPHRALEPDEMDGWSEYSRKSWKTVKPETLDKLTWVRISMAGLDHDEREVYVPDVDPSKTALGFSYVAHDIYDEPADPHHGKVSRPLDLLSGCKNRLPTLSFEERVEDLTTEILSYVEQHKPRYVRLLPNCLEPSLIPLRCNVMRVMADEINAKVNREVAFVQYKPPRAPKVCLLGFPHPVLNTDGYVYPCDSCVLNEAAGHKFANPWRVCHWTEVAKLYENPVHSLINDPATTCPGCVFTKSNELLEEVWNGVSIPLPVLDTPEHVNFI